MKGKLRKLPVFCIFIFFIGCAQDPPGFAEYNVGVGFIQTGEYQRAAELFLEATEKNPSFAEAFMNLGTSFYQLGRFREAAEAFLKTDSLFNAGEFVELRGISNEDKVIALHEMMLITNAQVRLLDNGDLTDEEIEELEKIVAPPIN